MVVRFPEGELTGMQLHTPRLNLREFNEADWKRVLEYQSDAEFAQFSTWEDRTAEDVKSSIEQFIAWMDQTPRTRFQLAVELRAEVLLIGCIGLRAPNTSFIQAELGFELDRYHWGHGYATEASEALIEFGFVDLGLASITSHCVSENGNSARVMHRIGMAMQRTEDQSLYMRGQWWNTDHFELSRETWEAARRRSHAR